MGRQAGVWAGGLAKGLGGWVGVRASVWAKQLLCVSHTLASGGGGGVGQRVDAPLPSPLGVGVGFSWVLGLRPLKLRD